MPKIAKRSSKSDFDELDKFVITTSARNFFIEEYFKRKATPKEKLEYPEYSLGMALKFKHRALTREKSGSGWEVKVQYYGYEALDKYYDNFIKGTPFEAQNARLGIWDFPTQYFDRLEAACSRDILEREHKEKTEKDLFSLAGETQETVTNLASSLKMPYEAPQE